MATAPVVLSVPPLPPLMEPGALRAAQEVITLTLSSPTVGMQPSTERAKREMNRNVDD